MQVPETEMLEAKLHGARDVVRNLPATETYAPVSITNMYGAAHVAARFCGMPKTPPILYRYWQHGWVQKSRQISPHLVASENIYIADAPVLVARKDEEDYLVNNGYNACAIGLPICYVKTAGVSRLPDSLLVMPMHGTRVVPLVMDNFYNDSFYKYIESIRSRFDFIAICLHQDDIAAGWDKIWRERGFTVVKGADIYDTNSLKRIAALVSSFDVVVTNGVGSHVAYAAAFGAKVSLMPMSKLSYDDQKDPFFRDKRQVLAALLDIRSQEIDPLLSPFAFLFDPPTSARRHIDWGRHELGFDNTVSANQLKRLLGWLQPERSVNEIRFFLSCFSRRIVPVGIKSFLKRYILAAKS